jgi:hypothetical protein
LDSIRKGCVWFQWLKGWERKLCSRSPA